MSIKVMTIVWEKSRNKRTAMLLLLAIADHAHDDGKGAYPGIDSLARKTRQTRRNVQLLLKTLEDSKELIIHEGAGPHGCNLYEINLMQLRANPDWQETEEEDDGNGTDVQGEKFSPPTRRAENFTGENSRAESAENFTGGVKNGAPDVLETDENKLENEGAPREISPEPLNHKTNTIESSMVSGKTPEQIWELILADLKGTMSKATYDTWVKPSKVLEWDVGAVRLKILVRNASALQWLDLRLRRLIENSARYVIGSPTQIVFVLKES